MDPNALASMMGGIDKDTLSNMMNMTEKIVKDNPDIIQQVMQIGNQMGMPTGAADMTGFDPTELHNHMEPIQENVMQESVPRQRKAHRKKLKKTKDLRLDIEVSLEELYKGTTIVKIVKTKRLKTYYKIF